MLAGVNSEVSRDLRHLNMIMSDTSLFRFQWITAPAATMCPQRQDPAVEPLRSRADDGISANDSDSCGPPAGYGGSHDDDSSEDDFFHEYDSDDNDNAGFPAAGIGCIKSYPKNQPRLSHSGHRPSDIGRKSSLLDAVAGRDKMAELTPSCAENQVSLSAHMHRVWSSGKHDDLLTRHFLKFKDIGLSALHRSCTIFPTRIPPPGPELPRQREENVGKDHVITAALFKIPSIALMASRTRKAQRPRSSC
jgi:hypothetical protein